MKAFSAFWWVLCGGWAGCAAGLGAVGGSTESSGPAMGPGGMAAAVRAMESARGTDKARELRDEYRRATEIDPKNPTKRFLWAFAIEDRQEAWTELNKISKLDERFAWTYVGMALILDGWKVYDQAERFFQKALALDPRLAFAYGRFGRMFLDRKEYERALGLLDKAVGLEPTEPEARLDRARVLRGLKKTSQAVADFAEVLKNHPDSFAALVERADALMDMGQKAEAVESNTSAIALNAKAYSPRFLRARLLQELDRLDEALVGLQEACPLEDRLECWKALAALAQATNNHDLLVSASESVIRVEPNELDFQRSLGRIFLAAGTIEKAQPCFEYLLEKGPDDPEALLSLAAIFEKGEAFSRAIEFLERVLIIDSTQPEAKAARERLFARFFILMEPIGGKSPQQVFNKNQEQIDKIFKDRLKKDPSLKGELLLQVKVGNSGKVEDITVVKNTVSNPDIGLSAFWNLKRSLFPTGMGASFDFSLNLKPGN